MVKVGSVLGPRQGALKAVSHSPLPGGQASGHCCIERSSGSLVFDALIVVNEIVDQACGSSALDFQIVREIGYNVAG